MPQASQSKPGSIRAAVVVALLILNLALLGILAAVVFGGSLNGDFVAYLNRNHALAPPKVALAILVLPVARRIIIWILTQLGPTSEERLTFLKRVFDRLRAFARKWQLVMLVVIVLSALLVMQFRSLQLVCYPAPPNDDPTKPIGAEGIALSVDERYLYLTEAPDQIAILAAVVDSDGGNEKIAKENWIGPKYVEIGRVRVGDSPQEIERSSDGNYLYVANFNSGNVTIVYLPTALRSSKTSTSNVAVGDHPRWIVVSPDGARIYVSHEYSGSSGPGGISVIDAKTKTVMKDAISGVGCPEGMAIAPNGERLYIASQCGEGQDPLYIADLSLPRVAARIPGLAVGNAVALSRDETKAYVTRANFNWFDHELNAFGSPLSVVDVHKNTVIKTIVFPGTGAGLALTPDGKYLLVTSGLQLSVIDTTTDDVLNTVSLRGYGNAIVVRSDGMVFVAVHDERRMVSFPIDRALRSWPCSSVDR